MKNIIVNKNWCNENQTAFHSIILNLYNNFFIKFLHIYLYYIERNVKFRQNTWHSIPWTYQNIYLTSPQMAHIWCFTFAGIQTPGLAHAKWGHYHCAVLYPIPHLGVFQPFLKQLHWLLYHSYCPLLFSEWREHKILQMVIYASEFSDW
jgi:hypothetical protein